MLRIVSGGQTGIDRGALSAALQAGTPCGGWCPRGRRAEDGVIPSRFPLKETRSPDYSARTRMNVLDSDATLIIHCGAVSGGTALTREYCRRLDRPCLLVDIKTAGAEELLPELQAFLVAHAVRTLNVAGPRESGAPGTEQCAFELVRLLLRSLAAGD